ncbi:MAG: amidohydrolase family protein, partial [Actinobacteria bacterium]|nr:amidohydrolase family protein [Actinomycetota bacterium]
MTTWHIVGAQPLGGEPVDIVISDGIISAILPTGSIPAPKSTLIEAHGLIALPGLVDLHTHLREPGREDAETVESGCRAAALGGFTAVHAMANTDPVADSA